MNLLRQLEPVLRPLRARIVNTVTRGLVALVDDGQKMQSLQMGLTGDVVREKVERFQNYGFTSVPFADAEAVVVQVGGAHDHSVVIVVDDRRYRLKGLAEGEVAMFTDQGDKIHIKRGGTIEVTSSTKVLVTSPTIELKASTKVLVTGKLDVTGKVTMADDLDVAKTVTGTTDVVGGGKSLKTHTHPHGGLTTTATVTGSPPAGTIGGDTGAPN